MDLNNSAYQSAFRAQLLAWYASVRRDLPWRREPSLYKTVVSEFMLQQTQVSTVLPYFERWVQSFSDFEALAKAPEEQVLKLWEGLGYYSRARNLQRLAQEMIHLKTPPRDAASWEKLPGVGPYTAAAVTSIALGNPVACVDGNVVRILTRLTADARAYPSSSTAAKILRPLANLLVHPQHPGDHNQAMMELGATLCTKQNPKCEACPVQGLCKAYAKGSVSEFPNLAKRVFTKRSCERLFVLNREGCLLLHQTASQSRRLSGIWELPLRESLPQIRPGSLLLTKTRGISQERIKESIYEAAFFQEKYRNLNQNQDFEWIPLSNLGSYTLSGPHKRWIQEILSLHSALQQDVLELDL